MVVDHWLVDTGTNGEKVKTEGGHPASGMEPRIEEVQEMAGGGVTAPFGWEWRCRFEPVAGRLATFSDEDDRGGWPP